ncbi:unnamed protein product, partial [Durusdinium trenchii]
MFERVPGRCKKAWLCDFCHLHAGRKKKGEPSTDPKEPARSSTLDFEWDTESREQLGDHMAHQLQQIQQL